MYKNKEVNVAEELTEILNNMNFNLPDKRMEQIDLKLNTLLNNMEYRDYINFIKSDEKLKLYDYLLGKYSNNDTLSKMLVKGFNLDSCGMERENLFSDVPRGNWANAAIAKAVDEKLMKGYPNGRFMPNNNVTRAEALTAMAKGLNNCNIDE